MRIAGRVLARLIIAAALSYALGWYFTAPRGWWPW